MTQIQYCEVSLPSTKPDLWFKDGICGACHAYEQRSTYDWESGPDVFRKIIQENKKIPIMIA